MIILPAIDIKDKQCVRLVKGDYATAHQVAESPYETAKSFKAANASWIHMVDLDGAKERKSDAEVRLEELQTLYDRRLITEEEYQEKRRDILDRL